MPYLDRDFGLAADAECLVERAVDPVAFVANVRSVSTAEFRGFGCQRDEFFGGGVRRRRVLQGCRYADRAVAHGIAHETFHPLQFGGAGRAVFIAEHHAADLRGAGIAGQIDAHALFGEPGEVLAEGAPVGRDAVVLVRDVVSLQDGVVERCDGAAFPRDLGGDALVDLGRQMRIHQNRELRLAQHVDEARSDYHAACVESAAGSGGIQFTDGGDASPADRDIAGVPWRAGAVDDAAIADHQVVGRGCGRRGGEEQHREQEMHQGKYSGLP